MVETLEKAIDRILKEYECYICGNPTTSESTKFVCDTCNTVFWQGHLCWICLRAPKYWMYERTGVRHECLKAR
jgi:hypothetical protein